MTAYYSTSAIINADRSTMWRTLTNLEQMSKWLGEPEMNLQVKTDWKINSPISIRGFHHANFENKGTVLQFDKEKILRYTHLSSVSRLPDNEENYTVLEFKLTPIDNKTQLVITINNFPTETIRKHLEFYWQTTIFTIKKQSEHTTTND